MKKLQIYDCDGVVRNFSWEGVFLSYKKIAAHFDVPLINDCTTVDVFRKIYSHDWQQNLTRMGIVSDGDVRIAEEIFQRTYFSQIKMFDWVPDIIPEAARNNTICIFTNSSSVGVEKTLNGVMHHFAMNVGHEQVEKLKPEPDGIYYIMDNLGFSPENTIMIGDSEADIVAGKAAGVATALVAWGATTDSDEIMQLNADTVVQSPEELLTL